MSFSYETRSGLPSEADTYARLMDHLRRAAQDAFTLGHIIKAQGSAHEVKGQGFLAIGEMLELTAKKVTDLATRGILQ